MDDRRCSRWPLSVFESLTSSRISRQLEAPCHNELHLLKRMGNRCRFLPQFKFAHLGVTPVARTTSKEILLLVKAMNLLCVIANSP